LYPQLGGNLLPDAWLSAAAAHLGEHLVSFDRDFRKLIARSQLTLLKPA
jgi:predicted nucleic acid-binding protein